VTGDGTERFTNDEKILQPSIDDYGMSWSPSGRLQALRPLRSIDSMARPNIDLAHPTPFFAVNPALLGNFDEDGQNTTYPSSDEAPPPPPKRKRRRNSRASPVDDGSATVASAQKTTRRGRSSKQKKDKGKEREVQDINAEWEGKC